MADNTKSAGAMTGDQLMQLFDMQKSAFHELGKKGITVKVGRGLYNGPVSIRNYVKHLREVAAGRMNEDGLDIVAQGARLKKAQADKAEFQVAVMRGEYLPASEIQHAFETVARSTQSAVLGTTATAAKDLGLDRAQTSRLDEINRGALSMLANEGVRIAKSVQMAQTSAMANETDADEAGADVENAAPDDQQGFDFNEESDEE